MYVIKRFINKFDLFAIKRGVMKEHHINLAWFGSVSIVALIILGLFLSEADNEQAITSNAIYNSPCPPSSCYYSGDLKKSSFCYKENEIIKTSIPEFSTSKFCTKKEIFSCYNGKWIYSEAPTRECV